MGSAEATLKNKFVSGPAGGQKCGQLGGCKLSFFLLISFLNNTNLNPFFGFVFKNGKDVPSQQENSHPATPRENRLYFKGGLRVMS